MAHIYYQCPFKDDCLIRLATVDYSLGLHGQLSSTEETVACTARIAGCSWVFCDGSANVFMCYSDLTPGFVKHSADSVYAHGGCKWTWN